MADSPAEYQALAPELLLKKIGKLEERMYQHARDLEFEEAAGLRDEINRLKRDGLGLPGARAG